MQTLTLSTISQMCAALEFGMEGMHYDKESIRRYALLTEEALLKWKEAFGEDSEVSMTTRNRRKATEFILCAPGDRVYPFETESETGDFLGHMHDRLLSGTGCEFKYSYKNGSNYVTLWLPKEDHEKAIFYRNVWALAIPVGIQYLLTTIITATDSILMGLLDQNSLSAISMTGAFINMYNILISSIVTGTTIFASQCWGRRDWKGINRVMTVSLRFSISLSALVFGITFFLPRQLMQLYTDIPELVDLGALYLRSVSPMFLFNAFYQVYYAIMKNSGSVVRCTVYMVSAAIVDAFLNVVFIFGLFGIPRMGIRGAALGTVMASGLQFLIAILDAVVTPNIHVSIFSKVTEMKDLMAQYVRKAMPIAIQNVTWTLANNIVTSLFGHMGSDIVAANGMINIISDIAFFFCTGLVETSGILVGSMLGNGKLETAKTYSQRYFKLSAYAGFGTMVAVLLLDTFVQKLPFQLSPSAFQSLRIMLLIVSVELMFKSFNCSMNFGGFFAGGDTAALTIIDTVNMWLIIVPIGALCLYVFKLPPIVVAILLHFDEITSFPFKFYRYTRYKWVRNLNIQV